MELTKESGLIDLREILPQQIRAFLFSFLKNSKSSKISATLAANTAGYLCFFEPSTRTRVSFEQAGVNLGLRWIAAGPEGSSLVKGESLRDHFLTLASYRPDFWVIRSALAYTPDLVYKWTGIPVLNAGDGARAHPSQGLLDAATLLSISASKKFKIALYGDVVRSRVARSDIHAFRALGYHVFITDDGSDATRLFAKAYKLQLVKPKDLRKKIDVIQCLRTQKERGSKNALGPLDDEHLSSKTYVMHPGPALIGEDFRHELTWALGERLLMNRQVEMGLRVRERLLGEVIERSAKKRGKR